jgi:methionine synthase II (cobalamin-independent)
MFATLLGALPRPPSTVATSDDEAVRAALAAQEAAGLELLSDGRLRPGEPTAARWRLAAAATNRPVKQTLTGPYTAGRDRAEPADRIRVTLSAAETLNTELRSLRDAGCTFVEIDEPAAIAIGGDIRERALFGEAHRRLTDGVDNVHLSLALTGGNADTAGAATFFDLPYASYALDLIAGPDNWRLVTSAPADRGIVCGAMSGSAQRDDGPEILVWAAHYAASTRGLDRVGLANAPGLDSLEWDVAFAKLARLADAARIAALPSADAIAQSLDPRAVNSRSAALGRVVPPTPGRRAPGSRPSRRTEVDADDSA